MLITMQNEFPEYKIIHVMGLVKGNSTRARNVSKDILAKLRTVFGGEIFEYTKLLAETREQSIDRMVLAAKKMGADGIVGFRISTSMLMNGASEFFAFGTAVKLKKK